MKKILSLSLTLLCLSTLQSCTTIDGKPTGIFGVSPEELQSLSSNDLCEWFYNGTSPELNDPNAVILVEGGYGVLRSKEWRIEQYQKMEDEILDRKLNCPVAERTFREKYEGKSKLDILLDRPRTDYFDYPNYYDPSKKTLFCLNDYSKIISKKVDSVDLMLVQDGDNSYVVFGDEKINTSFVLNGLNPRWDWGDEGQYAVVVYGNNANYYDFSRDFKSFTQKQLTGSGTPPSMTMTCVDSKKVNR